MFMTNTKKILIAIYLIGVICVGVLLARMFIGGNNITNPEAMLPVTYLESSSMLLALGLVPMCLASYLLYRNSVNKKRFLLFIPSLITVCNFVYWIAVIGLGFINTFLN